jgi:phenylalanyl-tRNA synthetase alpha chain
LEALIKQINNADSLEALETLRVDILGKKGSLTQEFAKLKSVPPQEKKAFAQKLNEQKVAVNSAIEAKKRGLRTRST